MAKRPVTKVLADHCRNLMLQQCLN